jgi:glutamate synthase (NADPH) small chain
MPVKKRTPMAVRDPDKRKTGFSEVALGYTDEEAKEEAERCLQCANPTCVSGCPVSVDIPGFILAIREGRYQDAIAIIKRTNNLPAVCGRVCPQESQCEKECVLAKIGEPIAIGRLERFAAEKEKELLDTQEKEAKESKIKVAVIGAGPAGLTAAGDLAKYGYQVTIFEALHEPGGVLSYGIPEFRLPKDIVRKEVEYIESLGVEILTDMVVGKVITIDELFADGYQAVFIGTGAGLPNFLGIPGENLNGVYSANEFLTRVNLMKAFSFPSRDTPVFIGKRVAVVGGGNVAMDSARSALRLGAESVTVVYRRSQEELPARHEEVEHAKEEGVEFMLLTNPIALVGDENGWVQSMKCIKMELGEPDASGRRRPEPIPGSEFDLPVDEVIIAIGQSPNPLILQYTPGLEATRRGGILAEEETGKTSKEMVYAGGDIVTGAATVILAMGAGKKAAKAIHEMLQKKKEGGEI